MEAKGDMQASPGGRLPLVQYWDTGHPPDEVARLMASWADDPAFAYVTFDRDAADAFIAAQFDGATLAAFRQCAVPAMQADLFRYCLLFAHGGIYVDADTENGGTLPDMIARLAGPRGALMNRHGRVANDFIFVRAPGDPLLARTIAIAVQNIERRISGNVWEVTGPRIFTGLYADPANEALFHGLPILPVIEVRKHVLFRWNLDYKEGNADWRNATTVEEIFRDRAS